jgi:hypothetical protein
MSRQTVRNAVATYFQPPAAGGLNKVFNAHPKRIEATWYGYGQPAGTQSGAVGVVAIMGETEDRIAIGGATSGKKWVHYEVQLEVFFHSVHRHSEDAMLAFDTVIDNIKAKLRADRYLNQSPTIVFEAGEKYLDGVYGEPRVLSDGSTEIWGAIRFEVSEVLTT